MISPLLIIALAAASCSRLPAYRKAPLNGAGDIAINLKALSALREGTPEFYTFDSDGKRIDFFLIRVRGDVQSYFDACAMCYTKRLGYRVEGGYIVCVACNLRYTPDELKTGIGGCHPIVLPGRTKDGFYIITRDAIKSGSKYF